MDATGCGWQRVIIQAVAACVAIHVMNAIISSHALSRCWRRSHIAAASDEAELLLIIDAGGTCDGSSNDVCNECGKSVTATSPQASTMPVSLWSKLVLLAGLVHCAVVFGLTGAVSLVAFGPCNLVPLLDWTSFMNQLLGSVLLATLQMHHYCTVPT